MRKVDSQQWAIDRKVSGRREPAEMQNNISNFKFQISNFKSSHSSFIIHHSSLRGSARRGVLLLVVLALLALFALVAVAFVIISGYAQRSAKIMQRVDQTLQRPEKLLNEALMQVARGPSNPISVMGPHSLLEDIYGNNYVQGQIFVNDPNSTPATTESGGPLMRSGPLLIDSTNPNTWATGGQLIWILAHNPPSPDNIDSVQCVGRVLTMRDGPAMGQSTRIVGYDGARDRFHLLAFEGQTINPGSQPTKKGWVLVNGIDLSGDYVINGPPFSGLGFGYNPTSGQLDQAYDPYTQQITNTPSPTTFPVALLPKLQNDPAGGANEDYDAADYQNMLFGAQIIQPNNYLNNLPSLHRPALVNYIYNKLVTDPAFNADFWGGLTLTTAQKWEALLRPYGADCIWDTNDEQWFNPTDPKAVLTTVALRIVNFKRCIMLRPLPEDHPNFNGGNPTSRTSYYHTPSGTLYLWERDSVSNDPAINPQGFRWDVDNDGDGVADSVWVDLGMPVRAAADGRLYKPLFAILCVDMDGRLNLNAHGSMAQLNAGYYGQVNNANLAGGPLATLNRGLGFGPADVNPAPLFPLSNPPTQSELDAYYKPLLSGNATLPGRYGLIDTSSPQHFLSWNKLFQYRKNYWDFQTNLSSYAPSAYESPPDLNGGGYLGLDLAGRPLYIGMGVDQNNLNINTNPYELDLATHSVRNPVSSRDNPFSVNELERILRPFDNDAAELPARLAALTSPTGQAQDSALLPRATNKNRCLGVTTESWDLPTAPNAAQSLIRGMIDKGVLVDQLRNLLAPELLAGLKMNLNRPFGNALDDNQNGVVDDPSAAETGETVEVYNNALGNKVTPTVCYDPTGGAPAQNGLEARRLLARYLYILATQVVDRGFLRARLGNDENVARYLAQWAVNVVDFYDRDSIMTRFDYDPRYVQSTLPSDGWLPVTDGTKTVWGCERPELLIAETLAFHDRCSVDDSATDGGKVGGDPPDAHGDYDQLIPPQGSLFIELYNPWGPNESPMGEMGAYNRGSNSWTLSGGVRLNQTTPQGHPVWRLAIVDNAHVNYDPDDPDRDWQFERSIYFVDPSASGISDDGERYYTTANIAPILPGRYAVIGPDDDTSAGARPALTHIGLRVDGNINNTRRIELNPSSDPQQTDQVKVLWNNGSGSNDLPTSDIKPPVAVVIDSPTGRRLNVSEPVGGYTEPIPNNQPFDRNDLTYLMINGTTVGYKAVHLQRLANPLLPWNGTKTSPDYNPYLSVDTMHIDLTAFNGQDLVTDGTAVTVMFATHQRGETNQAGDGVNNIWKQQLDPKQRVATNPENPITHRFQYPLQHTLGYLNTPFQPMQSGTTDPTSDPYSYRGDPLQAFPWLTWNNRPFASPLELLLVPRWHSSQLLAWYNPSQNTNDYTQFESKYPHLMNFFLSTNHPDTGAASQLYRVLDYVNVPSRFVETEVQGNPTYMTSGTHLFHPPFNFIPNYREPGRINLNTIYSEDVFKGMLNLPDLGSGNIWDQFVRSRRGYNAATQADILCVNNNYPTQFVRPFRSYTNTFMVPLDAMKTAIGNEINATLLRANPDPAHADMPLFSFGSTSDYNNTNRNPYFYFQELQRISNAVTTRSNVYAVWITVGYFEVKPHKDPATGQTIVDAAHPDGYELGQELGSDMGEIKRHRAFYMLDRSIPVGFIRGQDLNVEKAILLKRFIE